MPPNEKPQSPTSDNTGQPDGGVISAATPQPSAVVGATTNEPVVSFTPQTTSTPNTPSMPVVDTRQVYPSPSSGFGQADAIALENKRIRKRRLFIGGGIFGSLIVLAIIGAISYSLLSGFKTITYNNGKGDSFQLTFYSRYSVQAAQGDTTGFQELASKVSVNGLDPIAMTISKTPQQPSSGAIDCTDTGTSPALHITNKPTNNMVNICSVDQGQAANPFLYIGVLQSGSNYYAILIDENVNFQHLTSSQQNAQAGLKKINLRPYNNAITTIVSSIKPLQ